jgi:hypothetical protein
MALYAVWTQMCDEFDVIDGHLRGFAKNRPAINSHSHFTFVDECLLEGLLSRLWQAWCGFCRGCLIESCCGTTSGAGQQIAGHPLARAEACVSAAAIRAKGKGTVVWGGTNSVLKREPTWGDVDVLVGKVVPDLNPVNQSQLLAAFSSASDAAKALQRIRNASAHFNSQSLADVTSMQSKYVAYPITHATQALFWVAPSTGVFLALDAIEALREAGLNAIS